MRMKYMIVCIHAVRVFKAGGYLDFIRTRYLEKNST